MPYTFQVMRCPIERNPIDRNLIVAMIARAEPVGEPVTISAGNEAGSRVIRNHLAFRADYARNGCALPVTDDKGWQYFIRWIGAKPRKKNLHRIYRNVFAGNATKSPGQIAYEADVAAKPLYHDGTPRKAWASLGAVEQGSWERNPTPRF